MVRSGSGLENDTKKEKEEKEEKEKMINRNLFSKHFTSGQCIPPTLELFASLIAVEINPFIVVCVT